MDQNYSTFDSWPQDVEAYEQGTPLRVGDLVGPFCVERFLGKGSMASVWQLRHTTLDILRALKVMNAAPEQWRARFLREGSIQAQLSHANILRVYDVLDVHGYPALLMDYADDGSLAERLTDQPLDSTFCRLIATNILNALHIAHSANVIHRDIKPSNILLRITPIGTQALIADFGIARKPADIALTQTQGLLGTPSYMSPEQGQRPQDATAKADMFSFGVTLYHMLSGQLPFKGDDVRSQLNATAEGKYTPLVDVPADLNAIVDACLSLDVQARPSALDALEMLETTAQTPTSISTPKHVALTIPLIIVIIVLGVGVLLYLQHNARAQQQLITKNNLRALIHIKALEHSAHHPEFSRALLYAASTLDSKTERNLPNPSVSRDLVERGADVRVIPSPEQVFKILSIPNTSKLVGVLLNGDVMVWDTQTGNLHTHYKSSRNARPRRAKLSPGGRWLALIPDPSYADKSARSSVELIDLQTGKLAHTFSSGDTLSDVFFTFHPTKPQAMMTSGNGFVSFWDLESGAPQHRIALHAEACATYSPSGDELFVLGKGQGHFINTKTGQVQTKWSFADPIFQCKLFWKASHSNMLTISTGRAIINVDIETGKQKNKTIAHSRYTPTLKGNTLVLYGLVGQTNLYNYPSLSLRYRLHHQGHVQGVSFDRGAQQLATASTDGKVRIWSTSTGALLQNLHGHDSWVLDITSAQTTSGWQIWSAGRDRHVRGWSLAQPQHLPLIAAPKSIRWPQSGRMLSLMDVQQRLYISSPDNLTNITPLHQTQQRSKLFAMRWSQTGRYMLESRVTGAYLHQFWPERKTLFIPEARGYKQFGPFESANTLITLENMQMQLVHFSFDGAGSYTLAKKPYSRHMAHVTTSSDGQRLIATNFDKTIQFHDLQKWKDPAVQSKTACVHPSTSSAGTRKTDLILGDWSGLIEIWDTQTFTLRQTLKGHTDAITKILALKDGRILSSSRDHTLRLWQEDRQHILKGHSGEVTSFDVNDTQTLAASIGRDQALVIWSLDNATQRSSVQMPQTMVGVWFEHGHLRTLDKQGVQWVWPLGNLQNSKRFDNLRVCQGTASVVPVIPFPHETIWAPKTLCDVSRQPKDPAIMQ